jgi:hypothetical protein
MATRATFAARADHGVLTFLGAAQEARDAVDVLEQMRSERWRRGRRAKTARAAAANDAEANALSEALHALRERITHDVRALIARGGLLHLGCVATRYGRDGYEVLQ